MRPDDDGKQTGEVPALDKAEAALRTTDDSARIRRPATSKVAQGEAKVPRGGEAK